MILTLGGLGRIIIDLIMILIGSFRDINGRIVKYNKGSKTPSGNKIGVAPEIEQLANLRDKGIIQKKSSTRRRRTFHKEDNLINFNEKDNHNCSIGLNGHWLWTISKDKDTAAAACSEIMATRSFESARRVSVYNAPE